MATVDEMLNDPRSKKSLMKRPVKTLKQITEDHYKRLQEKASQALQRKTDNGKGSKNLGDKESKRTRSREQDPIPKTWRESRDHPYGEKWGNIYDPKTKKHW